MDMDTVLFGTYTVSTVLKYGGIALGAVLILMLLVKLFSGSRSSEHVQSVECPGCDWRGQVSRYAGKCPKCNAPLGDRKAGN